MNAADHLEAYAIYTAAANAFAKDGDAAAFPEFAAKLVAAADAKWNPDRIPAGITDADALARIRK